MPENNLTWVVPTTQPRYIDGAYNWGHNSKKDVSPESIHVKTRVGKYCDEAYGSVEYWKYTRPALEDTDIQCILGVKVIPLTNVTEWDNRPHNNDVQIPHVMSESTTKIRGESSSSVKVLSVIYISRKDGRICNDIYPTWCAETGLPFPEQLKHTALEDDVALSEQKLPAGTKNYFRQGYLSLFDCFRNKKIFGWFLPVTEWGYKKAFKIFKSAYKTSYKNPRKLNTWKRRRERR